MMAWLGLSVVLSLVLRAWRVRTWKCQEIFAILAEADDEATQTE